jgi:hypothetical protein
MVVADIKGLEFATHAHSRDDSFTQSRTT